MIISIIITLTLLSFTSEIGKCLTREAHLQIKPSPKTHWKTPRRNKIKP